MHDEFKEEHIIKKVGGRFKLTSLIQKRMVALNRGARPLVDAASNSLMEIVVEEIMSEKIYLDAVGEVAVRAGDTPDVEPVITDGPSLADL